MQRQYALLRTCTILETSKLIEKYMENLKLQLKEQIIDALNLEDMTPTDIDDAAPLFGEGLGLDSIDALELIMILDKHYGIKFANKEESKQALKSVDCMAEYVAAHRTK